MCREIDSLCSRRIGSTQEKIKEDFVERDGTIIQPQEIKEEVNEAVVIAVKARLDNGLQYVQNDVSGGYVSITMTFNAGDT